MKATQNQRKFKNRDQGQSMVELSLFLLMILVLLAGVLDFGNYMFEYQSIRDAAQEGAEFAALYPNYCDEIRNRIDANLNQSNNQNKRFIDRGSYTTIITIIDRKEQDPSKQILSCEVAWNHDSDSSRPDSSYHGCEGKEVDIVINHPFQISLPILSAIIGPTIPMHIEIKDRIVRPACPF